MDVTGILIVAGVIVLLAILNGLRVLFYTKSGEYEIDERIKNI